MERFCPKCGNKVSVTAKFCPHCGYNFALRNNNTQPTSTLKASRTQVKPIKKKSKTKMLLVSLLVILVMAGSGYYYWNENHSQNRTNQTTKSNSNDYAQHQSSRNSNTEARRSSHRSVDTTKLSTDIGPKGSAAAVTYYAAKNDIDGWQSMADSDDLKVDLSTDDSLLGSLSAAGQGMAYIVSDDGESGDQMLVYTIDKDDTINIYSLPNDYDSDSTYDPVKSIAKSNMIDSINSDHYAAKVKSLEDKVTINQEDEN